MSANPVRIPALRIGVIGAGRWGRNVIRTIQSLPGTQLDAVVSNNPNTAELVGDNCRVHQDVQSLLNGEKLDGIAICTPPATHFDIAHDILDAGIPIFIEKPLTFDPTQADTLVRLAAAVGTWGMVDHIHLFSGAFQKLLTALPDIGEVTAIKSIAGNAGPVRADADVLWDWGPHDVAMMLSIREFSVEGTKGTLRYIDGGPERRCVLETREKSKTLLVEAAKPLTTALGSFVACIQNVTPPLSNLAFGAEVVRILAVADGREAL